MDKNFYELLKNDEFGLLDQKAKLNPTTETDRVIESFLEINEFYKINGRAPEMNDIHERRLATRLKTFIDHIQAYEILLDFDEYKLLDKSTEKGNLEDEFGLLDLSTDDYSISNIVNVPKSERRQTDFVATRKVCDDFEKYKPLFDDCNLNIKNGTYSLKSFEHGDIVSGGFYVMQGILVYVAKIEMEGNLDKFGKEDGRTHCIFDNGTESFMKFRSLQKNLEKDGKTVHKVNYLENGDSVSGFIYILKSLSNDPKIQSIRDLYKVGFSTTEVEDRIKNAESDPTYLMAPVHLVEKIKCYNMETHRFERLIHRFFSETCLDLKIKNKDGSEYSPKEWFVVPLDIIENAIDLIISGEITGYEYDKYAKSVVKKTK